MSSHDNSYQRGFWSGEFGNSYIARNNSVAETDRLYKEMTGVTFEEIMRDFFTGIDVNSKILELGCNVGLKLSILKKIGFKNLFGLEINNQAFEIAKKNNPEIQFINSSIEEYDSKGEQYDLVFTSGVLIHIHPSVLNSVIQKIVNMSRKYIFGLEYYSDNLVEIPYRDHLNALWKQNFPSLFRKQFPSLRTIKEKKYHYKKEDLCDIAYLLEKI